MSMTDSSGTMNYGLLPEPKGQMTSLGTSSGGSLPILATIPTVDRTPGWVIQSHSGVTESIVSTPPPNQLA